MRARGRRVRRSPAARTPPGRFTFGGLIPGRYLVAFDPGQCGGSGTVTEWWRSAPGPETAAVIDVQPGRTTFADAALTAKPSGALGCYCEPPASWRFADVPDGNVHAESIARLLSIDVVQGVTRHGFAPDAPVTRGQLATMLVRALQHLAAELPATPPDAFADDTGSPHEHAINRLAAVGVFTGDASGRAAPAAAVSRAQAASLLVRAYDLATGMALRSTGDRFADDGASVHQAAINEAAAAALVVGTRPAIFRPADVVTPLPCSDLRGPPPRSGGPGHVRPDLTSTIDAAISTARRSRSSHRLPSRLRAGRRGDGPPR